jgi:PhnB protein
MPQLNAYVFFDGDCADAVRFYEKTLGAKVQMMLKAKDSPDPPKDPAAGERILHAHLDIGGQSLLASDWMAPHAYEGMKGFSLSLQYDGVDEAKRVFDALSDGGRVNMPMQKTFWSEAFGMLVDRHGLLWMIGGPNAPKP